MERAFPHDYLERLACHRPAEDGAPPPRRAAVAAVLRPTAAAAELLLMTRIEHALDPWSGQVALPGGGRSPEDEDLLATAVREAREEVGLDLARVARPVGRLAPVGAIARGGPVPMDITPYVFLMQGVDEPVPGDEAREAFWLPLDRVLLGEFDDRYRYRHGGVDRLMPCWRYEGRVIWGLTYRMVGGLLDVVTGRRPPSA